MHVTQTAIYGIKLKRTRSTVDTYTNRYTWATPAASRARSGGRISAAPPRPACRPARRGKTSIPGRRRRGSAPWARRCRGRRRGCCRRLRTFEKSPLISSAWKLTESKALRWPRESVIFLFFFCILRSYRVEEEVKWLAYRCCGRRRPATRRPPRTAGSERWRRVGSGRGWRGRCGRRRRRGWLGRSRGRGLFVVNMSIVAFTYYHAPRNVL